MEYLCRPFGCYRFTEIMKLRKNKNKKLIKLAMKFQPWDFGFNLEIEKEMLNRMYEFYSSDKPVAVGSERVAREVKLAIKLLGIIMEEDSAISWRGLGNPNKWTMVKYVNIKNANRFGISFELNSPILKDYLRKTKAWYLYNKLRLYKMQTWWE